MPCLAHVGALLAFCGEVLDDHLKDTLKIIHDRLVVETKHAQAKTSQIGVPGFIMISASGLIMYGAIQLDHKVLIGTVEIDHEGTEAILSAELPSHQFATFQLRPHHGLAGCAVGS